MTKTVLLAAVSCLLPVLAAAQPPLAASFASLGFGRLSDCETADWRLRVGDGCTASDPGSASKRCAEIRLRSDAAGYALVVDGAKAGRVEKASDLRRVEVAIALLAARHGWTKVRPATYSCGLARAGK